MSTPRAQITKLIEKGVLAPGAIDAALTVTQVRPTPRSWLRFIESLLLWLGGVAIAVGVVFFFAYNWADLGRFGKFILAQVFIVGAIGIYIQWQQHRLIAVVALLAASIGLGALLALFGQTYQTGADPWQLFFYWAILMLPWTIISRSQVLWLFVVLLLNVALALYFHMSAMADLSFTRGRSMMWLMFLFNSAVLVVWECVYLRQPDPKTRWAPRLIAVLATFPLLTMVTDLIAGSGGFDLLVALAALVWIVAAYWIYRRIIPDLFMLALICLWVIWIVNFLVIRHLIRHFDVGVLFLIGLLILGSGAAATTWLRSVHRQMQQ